MREFSYLLGLGTAGLKTYSDDEAMNERIREWLDNPMFSISDNPAWGHNLKQLRFEPQSLDLEALIELSITEKLPSDVKDLNIKSVRVEYVSIDEVSISISHNGGNFLDKLPLKSFG